MKNKKVNQQGTLQKDPSETICIENLKIDLNKGFKNWFIGFIEGSENTFIVNRRYLRFEINCFIKNEEIIYYIKKKLGFGNIRKLKFLNKIIIEFSVQDNIIDLLKLVNIFNGNFRSEYKNKYFFIFYKKLEKKLKKMDLLHLLPKYDNNIKKISLNNSWLLGFFDSKALFYSRWQKSKNFKNGKKIYLCIYLWSLDSNLLNTIKEVLNLNCKVEEKLKWNLPFFKLIIDDMNDKNKINLYLINYKLKSIKFILFFFWKKILVYENIYINTGVENFDKIDKVLKKLLQNIGEDELSKI
jgi:hypothetical protein